MNTHRRPITYILGCGLTSLLIVVPFQICGFTLSLVSIPMSTEAIAIMLGIWFAAFLSGAFIGLLAFQSSISPRKAIGISFVSTILGLITWFILGSIVISLLQNGRQPFERTIWETVAIRIFYSAIFVVSSVIWASLMLKTKRTDKSSFLR